MPDDFLDGCRGRVVLADNLVALASLPDASVDLSYNDPPFNTGKRQALRRLRTVHDEVNGDRTGWAGRRYRSESLGAHGYDDVHDDYLGFLEPRLVEIRRVLKPTGTLYLHLDSREVHYVKVLLDGIFGRDCFLNEVIWAYDYGARTSRRWPPKHDTILVYVKDPARYAFDAEAVDRIPYMAPGLVGPEKAARGKLPTDTWWHTIVPTSGRERTGYPTPEALGILRRMSRPRARRGRARRRLLRRQRHHRRGRLRARSPVPHGRRQPRGVRGHARPLRGVRGRGVRRIRCHHPGRTDRGLGAMRCR